MTRTLIVPATALALSLALSGCGAMESLAGVHAPPAEQTKGAPLSDDLAGSIATRVIDASVSASDQPAGAEGDTARAAVMSGTALDLAKARATLGATGQQGVSLTRPEAPKVLGLTAGQQFPRVLFTSTLDATSNRPFLEVLASNDITSPYLLENRVPMLPGSNLPALTAYDKGVNVLGPDGGTDLVMSPKAALEAYAAGIGYPNPSGNDAVDFDDSYAARLKQSQNTQAQGLGALATMTQTHTVVPESLRTVRLADGSALVLGRINRVDTVTGAENTKELTVPEALHKVVGATVAPKTITINAIESVAVLVPAKDKGKIKLIGVVEQLTGGSAS